MDSLLIINYFDMAQNRDTELLIKKKFATLKKQYKSIQSCQVDINLNLAANQKFFVVRNPDYACQVESADFVITDAFDTLEQQLNETVTR